MARTTYKEQGGRLYKMNGIHLIEINLESYQYGVIGISYANMLTSPIAPNRFAHSLHKDKFEKYYKEAIEKITAMK